MITLGWVLIFGACFASGAIGWWLHTLWGELRDELAAKQKRPDVTISFPLRKEPSRDR